MTYKQPYKVIVVVEDADGKKVWDATYTAKFFDATDLTPLCGNGYKFEVTELLSVNDRANDFKKSYLREEDAKVIRSRNKPTHYSLRKGTHFNPAHRIVILQLESPGEILRPDDDFYVGDTHFGCRQSSPVCDGGAIVEALNLTLIK